MDERLPPTERVRRSSEYQLIFRSGRCFRLPCLRIHHYRRREGECSRLGLVVSRRHGNAVQRRRLKRLLREVFRRNKRALPAPLDVVLVPLGPPRPLEEYVSAFRKFASSVCPPGGHSPPQSREEAAESGPEDGREPRRSRHGTGARTAR